MQTSSGPICDVCGKHILPWMDHNGKEEMVNHFKVTGIERELMCHNDCKQKLLDAGSDWTKLPDGPLRQAFEESVKEAEAK